MHAGRFFTNSYCDVVLAVSQNPEHSDVPQSTCSMGTRTERALWSAASICSTFDTIQAYKRLRRSSGGGGGAFVGGAFVRFIDAGGGGIDAGGPSSEVTL